MTQPNPAVTPRVGDIVATSSGVLYRLTHDYGPSAHLRYLLRPFQRHGKLTHAGRVVFVASFDLVAARNLLTSAGTTWAPERNVQAARRHLQRVAERGEDDPAAFAELSELASAFEGSTSWGS